jgi:hypothetical protein
MLSINGVACHEIGCPDAWKDETRECFECGCDFEPEQRYQQVCDCVLDVCDDDDEADDEIDHDEADPLYTRDPRSYALDMVANGLVDRDAMILALLVYMSHDEVRGALEANELSPRFINAE